MVNGRSFGINKLISAPVEVNEYENVSKIDMLPLAQ